MLAGGVTEIGPHPELTVGWEGAAGNITTLTVLLVPHESVPAVPANVLPQVAANT